MIVQPVQASPDTFGRFGMVVRTPIGTPTSAGPEYAFWSDLAHYTIPGETEIGVCSVFRQAGWYVGGLERHVATPEILIPIDAPFVLPLLLDGQPESAMTAFRVNLGEAVVINPGVWHGACLPADVLKSSYFVIFRRGTPQADVEKKEIVPVEIVNE